MLETAALAGQVEIMRLIHDAGFDPRDGVEALYLAVTNGHRDAAERLVQRGVDVDVNNGAALIAAVAAVQDARANQSQPDDGRRAYRTLMVESLLALGADPSMRSHEAARIAATLGLTNIVAVFLNAGVNLTPIGRPGDGEGDGKTLREIALGLGRAEVVAVIDALQQAQALRANEPTVQPGARSTSRFEARL